MKPLKIALFHNLPAGGAKRHTYEQLRELGQRGHHIEEFTFSTADHEFMDWSDQIQKKHVYPLNWQPLRPIPAPGVGPYIHLVQNLRNLCRLDRVSRQLATDVNAGQFDLLFAKDCQFTIGPQIMPYMRIPSLFYAHSLLASRDSGSAPKQKNNHLTALPIYAHSRMVRRLDQRNTRCAQSVLTNSRYTQQRLKQEMNVDAVVVYPGVDTQIFKPIASERADYLLSVGTVNEEKGHRLILEAVGNLPVDQRPKLLVAGNAAAGPEAHYLRQRAAALDVQLEIKSISSSAEMARTYARARALAIAPLYEWLGLAALEAMACGTPVIGVRQGGLLETIQDGVTGLLVERTPAALTEALQHLLSNREQAETMGRAGRAYIENYWTWPRAVDDLEAQFAAALSQGTRVR